MRSPWYNFYGSMFLPFSLFHCILFFGLIRNLHLPREKYDCLLTSTYSLDYNWLSVFRILDLFEERLFCGMRLLQLTTLHLLLLFA
jgi:hypothetical protein